MVERQPEPKASRKNIGKAQSDKRSVRRFTRRAFLQSTAAAGTVLGISGFATAGTHDSNGWEKGFPPAGITEWGPAVRLGNGTAKTFTTMTPSENPNCHGLYLERAALEGLPSASDLENSGNDRYTDKYSSEGEALPIHFHWSQEFFIPFPSAPTTPFTFLGLNWNPNGHPPVWPEAHFDIHFHMLPMETVDTITGPAAPTYDLPDKYLPQGFARGPVVEERVITDMGEHMADSAAPEMHGGEFTNTLIWGAYDPDGDGIAELTFVEPMITQAYLQAHSGLDRRPVNQPSIYARSGDYPTTYAVRDVPNADALTVTIESFESFEGEE